MAGQVGDSSNRAVARHNELHGVFHRVVLGAQSAYRDESARVHRDGYVARVECRDVQPAFLQGAELCLGVGQRQVGCGSARRLFQVSDKVAPGFLHRLVLLLVCDIGEHQGIGVQPSLGIRWRISHQVAVRVGIVRTQPIMNRLIQAHHAQGGRAIVRGRSLGGGYGICRDQGHRNDQGHRQPKSK